ncbi:hypothetical protein V8B97DRAFT_972054 [Scleroderma yunnanense]
MSPIPDLFASQTSDPTPSPSDESALPGRSGQSHPAASHVMIAIGTLVIITATIVSLAACYYQWRKRSKIIANGINDCLIRKLFLCCSRVSSFLSGSSGSSIVKPDTPQLLPSQSFHTCAIDSNTATSRKTYVGEGTTRVDDMADSWKTLADQDGLVCVSTTARKVGIRSQCYHLLGIGYRSVMCYRRIYGVTM